VSAATEAMQLMVVHGRSGRSGLFGSLGESAATLAAVLAVLAAGGCGEQDELDRAVTDAGITLRAPADGAEAAYAEVLRAVPSDGQSNSGTGSAASVLRATALLGQGTAAFAEASSLERRMGFEAEAVRVLVRRWTALNDQSDAAAAFDPTQQIRELRAQAQSRQNEIAVLEAERDQLTGVIDALTERVETLLERAAATRASAGELRVQMARMSAQDAAERILQVREFTRAADGFERQALSARAQAEVTQPQLDDVQARIEQRIEQRRVIADAIADLTARSDTQRARAAEFRETAAEVGDRIAEAVAGFRAFETDRFTPKLEEAVGLLERASREARNAGQDFASALLTQSTAEQRLADAAMLDARGARLKAELFDALASVEPPLDDAALYESLATDMAARAAEADTTASERFAAAAAAARRVRAGGNGRQAVQRLADRLESAANPAGTDADDAGIGAGTGADGAGGDATP